MLAMLYLMLFSALALGFYAQTSLSAQMTINDRNQHKAMLAAESGVQFMRYRLNQLEVRYTVDRAKMLNGVYDQLLALDDGQGNLEFGMQEIGVTRNALTNDVTEIFLPKEPAAIISLGETNYGFRCRITREPGTRRLVVKVAGYSGGKSGAGGAQVRGVEYTFNTEQIKADLLGYGVSGQGQIEVQGAGKIVGATDPARASVMTVTKNNPAVYIPSQGVISGKVYIANSLGTYSYGTNATVGDPLNPASSTDAGRKANTIIGKPNPVPEFPVIDTTEYLKYVQHIAPLGQPTGTYFKNIRIPGGRGTAATPYTFGSGTVLEGVIHIEAPNVVWFAGGCTIRGTVVGDNVPLVSGLGGNVVEFRGTATAYDMASLPDNDPVNFPKELQDLKGATCLLPGFHVMFSGGHAAVSGSIVSDQLTFTGKASGTIKGNVIGTSPAKLVVGGQGSVQIEADPTGWPAGVNFRHKWVPLPDTYRELERQEAKAI